jgi:hypothetical protein
VLDCPLQGSLFDDAAVDRADALAAERASRPGLIMCASLLENLPNLAGLCRYGTLALGLGFSQLGDRGGVGSGLPSAHTKPDARRAWQVVRFFTAPFHRNQTLDTGLIVCASTLMNLPNLAILCRHGTLAPAKGVVQLGDRGSKVKGQGLAFHLHTL